MGTRGGRTRQATMWVPTADLPKSAGHPFYERLNRVLDDAGFDAFVEAQCASFYADGVGRPSLAPGRYFRLLLLGYFGGLCRIVPTGSGPGRFTDAARCGEIPIPASAKRRK